MNLGNGFYIVDSISELINLLPLLVEDSGLSDIVLYYLNDLRIGNLTLSPALNYAFVLMDKVNNENELWASVGFKS